jgi:uncharacterized protein YbaR (Trm112 family)
MSPAFIAAYCILLTAYWLIREGIEMAISKELLDILVCPKCKGEIYLNDAGDGLICNSCKLLYEIKDDIPIMLIDEAKKIERE